MGVRVLGYLSLSWWTVILYYYTFSIIESPRHTFLRCIITLIITSVLPGTTSHFKKNTVMYSELDKQYLLPVIICLHLLLYNVVILYFVSVLKLSN